MTLLPNFGVVWLEISALFSITQPFCDMTSLFQRTEGDAFNLVDRSTGWVAFDPAAKLPTYGYDPTLAPGIVFSVAFGVTMLAHFAQAIQYRKWWYLTLGVGALSELIGWAARAAAHSCPYNKSIFSLQIAILIIGTQFFLRVQLQVFLTSLQHPASTALAFTTSSDK